MTRERRHAIFEIQILTDNPDGTQHHAQIDAVGRLLLRAIEDKRQVCGRQSD